MVCRVSKIGHDQCHILKIHENPKPYGLSWFITQFSPWTWSLFAGCPLWLMRNRFFFPRSVDIWRNSIESVADLRKKIFEGLDADKKLDVASCGCEKWANPKLLFWEKDRCMEWGRLWGNILMIFTDKTIIFRQTQVVSRAVFFSCFFFP